ncbi:MAG TPA: hypothetical protein PLN69_11890 [bacterium]|nr:hypothetical protein [bacterium]
MNTIYHINAVRAAFEKYMSPSAVDIIIRYNFNTDFYGAVGWKIQEHNVLPLMPLGRHWYKRLDHFDQMDSEELIETYELHKNWILELADDSRFPISKPGKIFRVMGRSSHSLTDIASHTNLVPMLYDFYRTNPEAVSEMNDSGKPIHEFLAENGPTLGKILKESRFKTIHDECLPKLFSFQSIPDKGPTCHEECNMDKPTAKGCNREEYPEIFSVATALSIREVCDVVDELFSELKQNNPSKYKFLNETHRDSDLDYGEMGKYASRAKWWSLKFGGWE